MVQSFKRYITESAGFSGTVYHGTASKFKRFEQSKARVLNDFFGGGVAYFTADKSVAKTYANAARKRLKKDMGIVYVCKVSFKNVFDVDRKYSGQELVRLLPDDVESFVRGSGIAAGTDRDKLLTAMSRVERGDIELTGRQVFDGLSRGMVNTAKTRDHLMKLGFDALRYNGGENMDDKRHDVYIAYYADDIKIESIFGVKPPQKAKVNEAEYQGRDVDLNKPTRAGDGKKKVYVKDGDKVKKVTFGSSMRNRSNNPKARKSFRARHKCDTAKDKTTARYWSCKDW